ncbi:hypothetical protein CDEST_13566 [Colletotrichum destructivum]|uniref:Uncharacterized protein n=1 Tax=Colletotrichum destructivum TaxID=34406 RepID=A0AAX4IZ70_9PEZI|nr:hypothetical protein CDEST_13566 [Colletotrichum destructivum]
MRFQDSLSPVGVCCAAEMHLGWHHFRHVLLRNFPCPAHLRRDVGQPYMIMGYVPESASL